MKTRTPDKRKGSKVAEVTTKVVALLEPLESEDRKKVIAASLTLLGEAPPHVENGAGAGEIRKQSGDSGRDAQAPKGISAKGNLWMKQNGLSAAQVEQVFDVETAGFPIIASDAPGKSDKARTHNAYVLLGISRLLATGETSFDDKDARKLCEDLGCYNKANHATYMSDKGNAFTGSKDTGWKLTAPGLRHGAELVKGFSAAK